MSIFYSFHYSNVGYSRIKVAKHTKNDFRQFYSRAFWPCAVTEMHCPDAVPQPIFNITAQYEHVQKL
jgi:hypothetical protein